MHKPEYTRLVTTNTSAKIGTIHAASSNVVTAEKVNGGGNSLKESQLPGLGAGKSSEGRTSVGSGMVLLFYTAPESQW